MNFLYACFIVIGIAILNVFAIILTAHGFWPALLIVLGGCTYAFAKLGCMTHE